MDIVLACGRVATVDDVDYSFLINWPWTILKGTNTSYAARGVSINGVYSKILMHRVIMGRVSTITPDVEIDHKDRDGLNNRRDNLQAVTKAVNQQRATERADNTTGFKGINWHAKSQKWCARLQMNNKRHLIGYFDKIQEAITALEIAKETMGYGKTRICDARPPAKG